MSLTAPRLSIKGLPFELAAASAGSAGRETQETQDTRRGRENAQRYADDACMWKMSPRSLFSAATCQVHADGNIFPQIVPSTPQGGSRASRTLAGTLSQVQKFAFSPALRFIKGLTHFGVPPPPTSHPRAPPCGGLQGQQPCARFIFPWLIQFVLWRVFALRTSHPSPNPEAQAGHHA